MGIRKTAKYFSLVSLVTFTAALSTPAMAATGGGHSDIEVAVENGKIVVENGILLRNGYRLFESEFGELGNPYGTDEPGFELDDGNFSPGQILGLEAKAALRYWNGSQWGVPVNDEFIEVIDSLSNSFSIEGQFLSGGSGVIDAADDEGGVHSHVDFEIGSGAGTPTTGAYLIELALLGFESDFITKAYTDSDNFYIAFNLGLDEDAFESSVDALAPVPLPAALPLMLSGLLGMFAIARRRTTKHVS